MKIPIWAWDKKQEKYVIFPTHLLETFEDGKQGFELLMAVFIGTPQYHALTQFPEKFKLAPMPNGKGFRYVYLQEGKE